MGEQWEDADIPDNLVAEADDARHQLVDVLSNFDDTIMEKYLADEEITADDLRRALRTGTLGQRGRPGAVRLGVQEQGRPADARRRRRLPAEPARPPAHRRARSRARTTRIERKADDNEPFSALAFKIMTDPLRRQADLPAGLLGHAAQGRHGDSTRPRTARSGSAGSLQMHANHREDMDACFAGDIVAAVGLKQTTTGDTLCDPAPPDRARGARRSPSPSSTSRSSRRPRPTRTSCRKALLCPVRGGPDVPGPLRRGDRPDGHLRHGRAAPRGARRPDAAGVQRRRQRRQAAGRLPRDDPQAGREDRGALRPPDRRPRPVRPRRHQPRADRARRRLRVRRQDHRWRHPEGVHPLGRRRHPGGHDLGRAGRVPDRRRPGRP